MKNSTTTRRTFLKSAAWTAAGVTIIPRHVLGGADFRAPSDTMNIAGVGVGGMGKNNLAGMESENIVALCDVDDVYAAETYEKYPDARRYQDFRVMLETQSDIDGVVIATPDHTHAVIAVMAMQMGKHVYVQKPLCSTVYEARVLARIAEETGVVTQMGNQGHSMDGAKLINQWVGDGIIGDVREVHVWTNRPYNYWPQGVERPTDTPPVPSTLQWDLFLGPARERPYHPDYTPFKWRGWVDYGTGSLGDMGAHLLDHPFWALGLEYPKSIETRFTPFNGDSYPLATITYYEFPARGGAPPVNVTWYDGGLMPPRDHRMGPDDRVNPGGGVFIVGDKGTLVHGTYGLYPYVIPRADFAEYAQPRPERREGQGPPPGFVRNRHEMNWINTIKGEDEISCPISYAAKLTETMLLGIVSLKAEGAKLEYDGENMAFTNNADANAFLHKEYREGWSL